MSTQEEENEVGDHSGSEIDDIHVPREVVLTRSSKGFGFNIRGQVSEGGKLRPIGGELYAPLQYISAVVQGGPAAEANIKAGDRLIEVNGISVEGSEHQRVVDLIKSSGNTVRLTVLSVTAEEASKLEQDSTAVVQDALETKSVPIQIPTFEKQIGQDGKEFVVYNIALCNNQVCSRRFREFFALDGNLKRQFVDFAFPPIPGRWPFKLSDVALDGRRRKLQEYLEKVCSVRVMFESELMQDFLNTRDHKKTLLPSPPVSGASRSSPSEIPIYLPDGSTENVCLQVHSRASEIYKVLCAKLGLNQESMDHFSLFFKEENFYCKMAANEFPSKVTEELGKKLYLRKWIFSPIMEKELFADPKALNLLFHQAINDIDENILSVPEEFGEKFESVKDKPQKLLKGLAKLESYNTVSFPHCPCDARKNGHIIVSMNMTGVTIQACSDKGVTEDQTQTFSWEKISATDGDDEGEVFMLQYQREGKSPKWIKVYSHYYQYMAECADLIKKQST